MTQTSFNTSSINKQIIHFNSFKNVFISCDEEADWNLDCLSAVNAKVLYGTAIETWNKNLY